MSAGVEVAGLALAAFPIVVYSISHYVKGLDTIRKWRHFRQELKSYSIAIETQSIWYLDTLEELLEGIVGSREELAKMLANPEHALWHKQEYDERLRDRLNRSYSLFFNLLKDMVERLEEFTGKLQLGPSATFSWDDASSVDREMRRLKMTLSKDYYTKTLQLIDKANKDLRSITQHNIRLQPKRRERNSQALLTSFRRIRRNADSLYNVFVTGESWNCTCRTDHLTSLRLETRHHSVHDTDMEGACKIRFRINLSRVPVLAGNSAFPSWQEIDVEPEEAGSPEGNVSVPQDSRRTTANIPHRTLDPKRRRLQKTRTLRHTSLFELSNEQQNLQASLPGTIASPVADICTAVFQNHVPGTKIGFLEEGIGATTKHYLCIAPESDILPETSVKSLDRIFDGCETLPRRINLTRGDRLHLAVTLASSALQLDQTSWLRGRWRSSDVLLKLDGPRLVRTASGVVYPYLSQLSSTGDSSKGKSIERAELKVPLLRNESLFVLAQTLVELCFGKNLSKLQSPEDIECEGRESIVRLNTISRLLRHYDIDTEMGKSYADVVSRCLYCPFNVREVDLDNEEVVRAVYDEIVDPLVNEFEIFTGSPMGSLVLS